MIKFNIRKPLKSSLEKEESNSQGSLWLFTQKNILTIAG